MDFWARGRPEHWPRYSSRRTGAKSPRKLRHARDCRPFSADRISLRASRGRLPLPACGERGGVRGICLRGPLTRPRFARSTSPRTRGEVFRASCQPCANRCPSGRARGLRLPSAGADDIPTLPTPSERAMNEAKANRVKARLPRGFADRGAAEIQATRRMLDRIRAVYERYGFEPVETPAIEYTDALGKFLPDQDRPGEGVFSFQDEDEQWLSLRYDLTAPLARYVAEHFDALPKPYRSYRFGLVFRNEKPGPGRYRQFMQFDADTVGSASPAADAEMCMMAADAIEALGIPPDSYVVKVNNRKVLDGVLETIGLGGEASAGKRLTVLRAIDKYDRLGRQCVEQLLGRGRKDESGDFTPGAGLDPQQITIVLDYVQFQLAEEVGDLEGVFDDWRRV